MENKRADTGRDSRTRLARQIPECEVTHDESRVANLAGLMHDLQKELPSIHSYSKVSTDFFFFSFTSLMADGPHHYHSACGHYLYTGAAVLA